MRRLTTGIYQLYKVSLPVALCLSAPLVLLVAWYTWSAFAQLDRYRRVGGDHAVIDRETLHIALHDEISRDLRRFFLADRPDPPVLATFELSLPNASLDELASDPIREGKGSYVDAHIRKDGVMHKGRVRTRGRRHWHWLGAQKSMKVRLDKGDLINGVRVFNLINDVTPFGLEEEIILDLAREHRLLTPEYRPVRLRINNADMGVYRYEAHPTEGFIRRAGRLPGSIYSGNTDATGRQEGVGDLFGSRDGWRKAAWRVAEEEDDFAELERLLNAVQSANHREFRDLATHELDLDKLALFDALDVTFGGDQHDYVSNHKLFYDAYRGRFEPIAWNFRAFTHDPAFNLVENPLLLRLKSLPEFLWLRDRKVYELITGPASAAAVRTRAEQHFATLRPELAADPYWDAYKLLARSSRFHRFMVRPMNAGRWLLAIQSELRRYSRRVGYLLDLLEAPGLEVTAAPQGGDALLTATVSGHAAYALRELTVTGDCGGRATAYADVDGDGVRGPSEQIIASAEMGAALVPRAAATWTPGVRLIPRTDGQEKHGAVTTTRVPRSYRYFLTASCPIEYGFLEVENLITGALERREFIVSGEPPVPRVRAGASTVPTLSAGEESPHPWSFGPEPETREIVFGPGPVTIDTTRVFESHEQVTFAAGTEVRLAAGASLVFLGPVHAEGTLAAPVRFRSGGAEPFGGILLLGPATAGSRFVHVDIHGGSHPEYRAMSTPSVMNIYDTADITLKRVTISGAVDADDLIHMTYVDGFRLHEVTVLDAPVDGIDIEMSTGDIRGARVLWPGDECIDLMGSRIRLVDSLLVGCTNNGISAGEETELRVHGAIVADARVGVLAKNGSTVRISRSLIYRAERALRTNRREVHYDAASVINAQDLYAVDCDDLSKRAKKTRIDTEDLHRDLPVDGDLDYLRRQVLGLSDWNELDRYLTTTTAEARQ